MSTKSTLKEDPKSEIEERSEEELLEEKIRNQQTLDSVVESDKNWSWLKPIYYEIVMNFKRSPFSILDKDKREMDYIKSIYKKKIESEIESYKESEDEDKRDTIQAQDILMLDRISI